MMGMTQSAATKRARYGPDYYQQFGRKGGTATKERYGEEYYERLGSLVLEMYGVEHYREMGRRSAEKRKARRAGE